MYCKRCGAPVNPDFRFCYNCGELIPERPLIIKLLIAAGKSACYLGLFFLVQSFCIGGLSAVVAVRYIIGSGGSFSTDYLYGDILKMIAPALHYVLILSAILTLFILWVFYRARGKKLSSEISLCRLDLSADLPLSSDTAEGNIPPRRYIADIAVLAVILLMAVAAQLTVSIGSSVFYELVPSVRDYFDSVSKSQEFMFGGSVIVQFIDIALFTPLLEETVFRGLIYTRLRRAMPVWCAAVLSSVIFGAMHGSIFAFIYAGLLGLALAALYEKYHSLYAPVALHFGFNAASFIVLPESFVWNAVIMAVSVIVLAASAALLLTRSYKETDVDEADSEAADGVIAAESVGAEDEK